MWPKCEVPSSHVYFLHLITQAAARSCAEFLSAKVDKEEQEHNKRENGNGINNRLILCR